MLEILGKGYVIEHCIAFLKEKNEAKSFRIYVTDALSAICENTTHYLGTQGMVDCGRTITKRWVDVLNPPPEKPEDNRPSEEIAADIWSRIRGR